MKLLQTSLLSGIATVIKILNSFILNKILAIYVGPSGYMLIGQFQNFIQIVTIFSGNAINNGVVKYTAEFYEDEIKQRVIWKTAGTIILIFSLMISILILLLRDKLSLYLFNTIEYEIVFLWFSFFLIFFNFNAFLIAVLNGKKEIARLTIANIIGSFFSLITSSLLSVKYGIIGALISLSIYQSLNFIVTLFICYKRDWFNFNYFFGRIDPIVRKKLSAFALMAFIYAVFTPVSQMIVRYYLANEFGLNYAGYWEAMNKISASTLMLVTTALSVYYLPKLSELKSLIDIKNEVYNGYKIIFPLALIGCSLAYICKDWIIALLFTKDFFPVRDLFFWQMVGDTLKIGSWILAYVMTSKAMVKLFIITEISFSLSYILLILITTKLFGFSGASLGYAINYALYWSVMSLLVFKKLRENT